MLRRLAISLLLTPVCAEPCRHAPARWAVAREASRPCACAMPALTRSCKISCSNSANTASIPANGRPLAVVSSKAFGERNGCTQLTKTKEIFGDEREPFSVRTLRAVLSLERRGNPTIVSSADVWETVVDRNGGRARRRS
jgi:hypothetical protein